MKAVSAHHGPSERFTANLADLDHSTLNLVTGQAGNFLSPYYMDQWKAWYEGTTFTLPFSAQAVKPRKLTHLQLDPGDEGTAPALSLEEVDRLHITYVADDIDRALRQEVVDQQDISRRVIDAQVPPSATYSTLRLVNPCRPSTLPLSGGITTEPSRGLIDR